MTQKDEHILPEKLFQYLEGALNNDEKNELNLHFSECKDCSNELEKLNSIYGILKRETSFIKNCPTSEDLILFSEKDEVITDKQKTEIINHLAICPKCRQIEALLIDFPQNKIINESTEIEKVPANIKSTIKKLCATKKAKDGNLFQFLQPYRYAITTLIIIAAGFMLYFSTITPNFNVQLSPPSQKTTASNINHDETIINAPASNHKNNEQKDTDEKFKTEESQKITNASEVDKKGTTINSIETKDKQKLQNEDVKQKNPPSATSINSTDFEKELKYDKNTEGIEKSTRNQAPGILQTDNDSSYKEVGTEKTTDGVEVNDEKIINVVKAQIAKTAPEILAGCNVNISRQKSEKSGNIVICVQIKYKKEITTSQKQEIRKLIYGQNILNPDKGDYITFLKIE